MHLNLFYDIEKLIKLINNFKEKYHVEVYLEPGEAIGWETGALITTVLDIVHNGMDIAILDTSAEAHMPDTIIMPYRADVRNAGVSGEMMCVMQVYREKKNILTV